MTGRLLPYAIPMQTGQPSRTALGAAIHRAAHQLLEGGSLFADPLAMRILGPEARAAAAQAPADGPGRGLRLFIALRSRLAEDALASAFEGGVRQLVVLGAGLDTYAYRNPLGGDLRMFEVDHPATQAWKRRRLAEAGLAVPGNLVHVPVDFEREEAGACLARAGFLPDAPSFFAWLGVVPYLTEPAIFGTLGWIGSLPGGARVVFDYGNPPAPGEALTGGRAVLARRVEAAGEAFRTSFETQALHARLGELGFRGIEDWDPARIRARFFPDRQGAAGDRGGHIVIASTQPA